MKYFIIPVLLLFSISAIAATKTWIGDVDSDWSNPNNWNGNSLPDDEDDIIIDADDYTTAPIMTANSPFTVDDITIRDGGIFTKTGGLLIVEDDIIVEDGTFNNSGGSLEVDDDIIVEDGTFNKTGGSLTVGDDIVVDDGTFTNSGGSLNVDKITSSNNGTVNLTGGIVTMEGDLEGSSGSTFNISTTVTQTDDDERLEIGTDVTFNISDGANITGFEDIDFNTNGGGGTFNMTGGILSISDDFKIQDGDDNTVTVSGGTLDIGDDFEMETDNNNVTFSGTADVNLGGDFEFGANGDTDNDATNSNVTVGDGATLDVDGDINFYEGGDGNSSYLTVEEGGSVTAADIDDFDNSVIVEPGGMVMSGGESLPVELLAFNGEFQAGSINLTWTTASELNNEYFEVQRSNDGVDFYPLGIVEGNGNSNQKINYDFIDYSPLIENQYYRLLQVDFDGNFEYLPTIIVKVDKLTNLDISIYPNPSASGNITIQNLGFIVEGLTQIKVNDEFGSTVFSKTLDAFQQKTISGLSNLSKGIYFITIINNGRIIRKRVVLN